MSSGGHGTSENIVGLATTGLPYHYLYHNVIIVSFSQHAASCSDGDVRVVGGDSEREGRLEVCFSQRWGTVNGDGWFSVDTQVACRQLGYETNGE